MIRAENSTEFSDFYCSTEIAAETFFALQTAWGLFFRSFRSMLHVYSNEMHF